ncbi:MAG TPA: lipoyl(octanoyl) transferase LipB [Geminicoccaceae bacterium]|nr:lipoyl(octanoyl) transferase LipB [Geminicoccaceae bacterium]
MDLDERLSPTVEPPPARTPAGHDPASAMRASGGWGFEWRRAAGLVPYPEAVRAMEERVALIHAGAAPELIWLLEHPPLYTAGTSAAPEELLAAGDLPVYRSGRGGRFTYHGPGQRVVYILLDLRRRRPDVREFVWRIEDWAIRSLARLGVRGERRAGRVGIWVTDRTAGEAKIAAIGVRLRRWVSYHGMAINVSPNLDHFRGIVPCGISEFGVTSLADLGKEAGMEDLDGALRAEFPSLFAPAAWTEGSGGPGARPAAAGPGA